MLKHLLTIVAAGVLAGVAAGASPAGSFALVAAPSDVGK
jgi:hypothetical protein